MWESVCTDLASYYVFESFAIFDPPFALAPKSYLVPPSPAASSPKVGVPPPIPANPTAAYDPPATYLPDLSGPPSSAEGSVATSIGNSLPSHEPAVNAAQPAAVPLDPAAKPTTAPDPPNQSQSGPQEGDSAQSGSPDLGSVIFGALGKNDPGGGGNADSTHIIQVPGSGIEEVTVDGQILSISHSGVYVSGTSYSPEGPAITQSGGVISLVSTSPALGGTTKDEGPPMNHQPFTPSVQTIAGHNVVSNTSGVYIAGSSLSAGGKAITVSSTVISLSPAGTLVIGSSSIALSLAYTQGTSPKKFNLDGVTIEAEPSAAVIDGITLTPDAPGTVINGNRISLEQGRTLVVGTSRLVLPAAEETTPKAFNLDGVTVQLAPSAVLVDGTTLTPGSPGVFIDGNRVSLDRDRTLNIGTSHLALPPAAQERPLSAFNVNGMTVQAQQSAVVINGVSLTPGGPGATINGSSVSLEPSGTLDIGTGRLAIPTVLVNGTSILQTFEGAQEKAHRIPRSWGLAAIIVSCLWMLV